MNPDLIQNLNKEMTNQSVHSSRTISVYFW